MGDDAGLQFLRDDVGVLHARRAGEFQQVFCGRRPLWSWVEIRPAVWAEAAAEMCWLCAAIGRVSFRTQQAGKRET